MLHSIRLVSRENKETRESERAGIHDDFNQMACENDRVVGYTNLSLGDGRNGYGRDLTLALLAEHGRRSNIHC